MRLLIYVDCMQHQINLKDAHTILHQLFDWHLQDDDQRVDIHPVAKQRLGVILRDA